MCAVDMVGGSDMSNSKSSIKPRGVEGGVAKSGKLGLDLPER